MSTVLVTGNEGYIGSVLVERLVAAGHEVTGLDSGAFKDVEYVPRARRAQHQIYKDIRDATVSDLVGMDAVIHLAALSNDPLGDLDPALTYQINYEASVHLAELARHAGVPRFLYSSSCSMYGVASRDLVDETAPFNPQTPYAESKVKAEAGISRLADQRFCPVFLRNATAFGTSPRMRFDLMVQNLAASGYLTGAITVLSDGSPWRPLVHVEDVADAFLFLMTSPREQVYNQAFNIGHRENNLRVKEVAEIIRSTLPGTEIRIENRTPADTRSYRVDFSRLYALGFVPRFTVPMGVSEICETFRQRKLAPEDFESDKYITLKRYVKLRKSGVMDESLRMSRRRA